MIGTRFSAPDRLRRIVPRAMAALGSLAAGLRQQEPAANASPFDVFLAPDALAINRARQEHLASLGLDLKGKSVLEVGAGIGLHTPFFLERGCSVLVTDGNAENVAEIRRRHPDWQAQVLDLEKENDLRPLGDFDLVYCYGLLYHLKNPELAIRNLAQVCKGQILLETCVALGEQPEVYFLRDFQSNNQAVSGIGCRPTRIWVMQKLKQYFGNAYMPKTQPDYPDFQTDWALPETRMNYRAIFVGSKVALGLPGLVDEPPRQQHTLGRSAQR